MTKRLAIAVVAISAACAADTIKSALIRTTGDPAVQEGKFYGYQDYLHGTSGSFAKCKALAEAEHVPLVVIWGEESCTHCSGFATRLNADSSLPGWMAEKRAIFAWFKGKGGIDHASVLGGHGPADCLEAYLFTVEHGAPVGSAPWPFFAIYYPMPDGTKRYIAGTLAGDGQSWGDHYSSASPAEFMGYVDSFLGQHVETPVPGAATFGCGNADSARLEAMPSTSAVWVPLVKTNLVDAVTTNVLKVAYPDGQTTETNVVWEVLESQKDVRVEIAGHALGKSMDIRLYDGDMTLNDISAIHFVEEAEPDHHFPLWLGERTEDTLGWGEWTFDLDIATNKVRIAAAAGTNAYTLVIVGGGLWCPDCISCETYLTGDARFAEWARTNNIALVVSDQPQSGTTKASMMTHDVSRSGTSGSYYLSRKGLMAAQGMAQFSVMTNRSYNIWKIEPTALRVANPTFILFRPDGTIAGRLNESRVKEVGVRQNNERYDFDENMSRLSELLRLAADATEEKNGKPGTTTLALAYGNAASGTLQVNDTADTFSLAGVPADVPVRLALLAPYARIAPSVTVGIFTNDAKTLTAPVAPMMDGVWRFTAAQIATGLCAVVSAYADSRYQVFGGDTEFAYSLSMDENPPDPGVVGFSTNSLDATEGADRSVCVTLTRTRGFTSNLTVRVTLDAEATTADRSRFEWVDDLVFTWRDGEMESRRFDLPILDDDICDGDGQKIVFALSVEESFGANVSISNLAVNLAEDDIPSPGRIGIASTVPAMAKDGLAVVKSGSDLAIDVVRLGGSAGFAGCAVRTSSATDTLDVDRLEWTDKNANIARASAQTVTLHVGSPGDREFMVWLVPDDGTSCDSGKRMLSVRVLADDMPTFQADTYNWSAVKTVRFSAEARLADPLPDGTSVLLSKVSGALPGGVAAAWDSGRNAIVFDGIPNVLGMFEAKYQLVLSMADGTSGVSLPVSVSMGVLGPGDINPTLGSARAWSNLPVIEVATSQMVGVFDIAIPPTGRVSARYRMLGGSAVSFGAPGWDAMDVMSGDAQITSVERSGCSFGLVAGTDGLRVSLSDPAHGELRVDVPDGFGWSAVNSARAWRGQYTVAFPIATNVVAAVPPLCSGVATLSLRFASEAAWATGRMTYVGVLPNGIAVSGSAVLLPYAAGDVCALPILAGGDGDALSGVMRIIAGGEERASETYKMIHRDPSVRSVWTHEEGGAPSASYSVDTEIYGSWYEPPQDWSTFWFNNYGTESLPFKVGAAALPAGLSVGEFVGADATMLAAGVSGIDLADKGDNPLRMTFSKSSDGRIAGKFRIVFNGGEVWANYKGVMLPGWTKDCGCGVEGEHDDDAELPFAIGACWFFDRMETTNSTGRVRVRTLRVGCPVSIGL